MKDYPEECIWCEVVTPLEGPICPRCGANYNLKYAEITPTKITNKKSKNEYHNHKEGGVSYLKNLPSYQEIRRLKTGSKNNNFKVK